MPEDIFYKKYAAECSKQQISINVFAFPRWGLTEAMPRGVPLLPPCQQPGAPQYRQGLPAQAAGTAKLGCMWC